eukprot:sb/3475940/
MTDKIGVGLSPLHLISAKLVSNCTEPSSSDTLFTRHHYHVLASLGSVPPTHPLYGIDLATLYQEFSRITPRTGVLTKPKSTDKCSTCSFLEQDFERASHDCGLTMANWRRAVFVQLILHKA